MASIPSLKLHRTGQSYVWYNGKTIYFGKHGEPSTEKAYWRWRESLGPEAAGGRTVGEVITLFEQHKPLARHVRSRIKNLRDALGSIAFLEANNYGPAIFREHRASVASTGTRSARQINDLMRFMRRMLKWGVQHGYVKVETWQAIGMVEPLTADAVAKQSRERQPANLEHVYSTLPHLNDNAWAMIRLLMLTGARPGEIVSLRKSEIVTTGTNGTWYADLRRHKTASRGKRRWIVFGPEAQEILAAMMPRSASDWVFPSEVLAGDHYRESSLRQAVGHACRAAGVPHWTPYQIRHAVGTDIAREIGLEQAAAVLGHSSTRTTQIYTHQPDFDTLKRAI